MKKVISIVNSLPFILFLFTLILLTGCKPDQQQPTLHSLSSIMTKPITKSVPTASFFSLFKLPVLIPEGDFNRVVGWLNDNEIIYMTHSSEGSNLYRHELINGKSSRMYETKDPIIATHINPNQNSILIHTSPSTYEGKLVIIDTSGKEWYAHSFPSVEMLFEWNQYNSKQLFITAFKEDWSFSNYYLDVERKELSPVDVRKPFAKWTGESKLAFLDWNEQDISLLSPLVQKEFEKEEFRLKDNIFQFDTFVDKVLTITVDSVEQLAKYTFYSGKMVEEINFKVPVLTSYSGWLVPNYELTADQKKFLTMVPLESAEADTYRDGYQLISLDLLTGKKEVILENTDNVPFSCSPNMKHCLMGYQFEKVLNLEKKMMLPLF